MAIKPNNIKKSKFVKALAQGKSKREAAIAAGYSPGGASPAATNLLKDEDVQRGLVKWAEKHELGAERVAKEYDAGLKYGKKGSHLDYLRDIARINGIISKFEEDKPQSQIIIVNAIDNYQNNGGNENV